MRFSLVVFGRDAAARMREGKRKFPAWNAFVAMKNEGVGWGFWLGLAAVLIGISLLPL